MSINFCTYLHQHIFDQQRLRADGILFPHLHKALSGWLQLTTAFMKLVRVLFFLLLITYGCADKKYKNSETAAQEERIKNIEIHLYPSFNNYSILTLDNSSNTVKFQVDTAINYRQGKSVMFSVSLDSFRLNTLVDSFYSTSFLKAIRFKTENRGVMDGLSIYTVVHQGNKSDTIDSGNVYPQSLSKNIISQIDYISNSTNDWPLKIYIDELKSYFH